MSTEATKEAFMLDGQLCWCRRVAGESRMSAIARSVSRRAGAPADVRYDHAATLSRGSGEEVYEAVWFDGSVWRRPALVLPSLR